MGARDVGHVGQPFQRRNPRASNAAPPGVVEALSGVPLFASLQHEQLLQLARLTRRGRFARGDVIFSQGEGGDRFYVIVSGQVKVSVSSDGGQEAILVVLDAGESFGELALLDEQPRSATIAATEATEVLAIHKQDFDRLVHDYPAIALGLLRVMARRLRDTDRLVEDAAFLGVAARIAKKLLALADSYGRRTEGGIELDLRLTQQDLAAMIGATRESVNKQLRALRDNGTLAVHRQRITILDPAALSALAPVT